MQLNIHFFWKGGERLCSFEKKCMQRYIHFFWFAKKCIYIFFAVFTKNKKKQHFCLKNMYIHFFRWKKMYIHFFEMCSVTFSEISPILEIIASYCYQPYVVLQLTKIFNRQTHLKKFMLLLVHRLYIDFSFGLLLHWF